MIEIASMTEQAIPWQAQLGVAAAAILLLVTTLSLLVRWLATGKLLTKTQADSIAEAIKSRADEAIANQSRRGDEWKETALVERQGRIEAVDIAAKAVETNKAVDYLFRSLLPVLPRKADDEVTER